MKTAMSGKIKLAPVLDITAAAPLVAELQAVRGKDVAVGASEVERLGAQCIQVLLSAASTWTHDGVEFDIKEPSAVFAESLQATGLEIADFTVRNV